MRYEYTEILCAIRLPIFRKYLILRIVQVQIAYSVPEYHCSGKKLQDTKQ